MVENGMKAQPQVLICDDDIAFQVAVKQSLKGTCECRSAHNGDEALVLLRKQRFDIVLLDVQMRSDDEGLRFIPKLKEADEDLTIVMASTVTDFRVVKEAMRLGATDYLAKEASPDEIVYAVLRILDKRRLAEKASRAEREAERSHRTKTMIGDSPSMQEIRRMVERLRRGDGNVLITGETGTGKEVVARQLRGQSADGALLPFIAVDASTIQSSTAESLLFGHEKGSFTGAERTQKGYFEEADGGIIYFDEIGNMPLDIQPKLLRAIQEQEIVRHGSTRPIPLQFRVVCATNMDLEEMAKAGRFKFDLYQRLNVLPIHLPPLRERKEDVPALLEYFARKRSSGLRERTFTPAAIEILQAYSWPGNIRELESIVAYLFTMTDSPEIDSSDIPPKIRDAAFRAPKQTASAVASGSAASFYERVARVEKEILSEEYARHDGNISKMAMQRGMDRSHLYTKLREHDLKPAPVKR